jgi:hypothetical protein
MREPWVCCHCCGVASPVWTRANIKALNGVHVPAYCTDALTYVFCFE